MTIKEVNTNEQEQLFYQLPLYIYKNDTQWIQPLEQDVKKVFDTNQNKLFQRGGTAIRWNLFDDKNNHIGRIAAFVNPKYEGKSPVGGIGFFECINNREAANLLFDTAKKWLLNHGMETMDGPINFGERDQWWGLLVEGFYEPLYGMNYNPEYYIQLFENYGFKTYFNQECFALPVKQALQPKFQERYEAISKIPGFKAEHLKKNNIERYIKAFHEIYNKAWATHGGGKEMSYKQAELTFKKMKPVIDEKLVWFVFKDERPIAFWLNLPDLNQYFKHLKGKFGLLQKLQFLYYKTFAKSKRIVGLAFGVIPEYHGQGIDNYMIIAGKNEFSKMHYTDYEMQWIGDFNPKMINVAKNLGSNLSRRLRTYRYHFDNTRPIERHRTL